jgi:hypothetical protein
MNKNQDNMRKVKIIGMVGPKGVGKTTFANQLANHTGCQAAVLSFADPLRVMAMAMGIDSKQLVLPELKHEVIPELGVTPRHVLQSLGTEWGRKCIHPDVWVWAMQRQIERHVAEYHGSGDVLIFIDDCRFANEAQWILNHGGMLIEVERDGVKYTGEHSSEMPMPEEIQDEMFAVDVSAGDQNLAAMAMHVINYNLKVQC